MKGMARWRAGRSTKARRAFVLAVAIVLVCAVVVSACDGSTATSSASGPTSTEMPTTTMMPTTTTVPIVSDWSTYHHDLGRSGISGDQEPLGQVTQAWTSPELGEYIYAQPLVVGDRVIVATEGNSVYSLDVATGGIVWQVDLGTPVPGGSLPCGNINPSGITGTPFIDTESRTIYVVAFLNDGPRHELVALDLDDGSIVWKRTVDPPGLSPKVEQQRGALSLVGDMVYVPFGGLYGDCGQYKGAIVGVPTDNNGDSISYVVPTSGGGGIWNTTGLPVDADGDLWVATGNTASRSTFDYGNAVIRLSPEFQVLDYFAPSDWIALNSRDLDLNGSAPVLLGARVLIIGKDGTAYLLDSADLGGIGSGLAATGVGSPAFGTAIVQDDRVFVPCYEDLVAIDVKADQLSVAWKLPGGSGSPIMAAGLVWTLGYDGFLKALDPADGTVVYSLEIGKPPSRFVTPSAANGRLFIADGKQILALNLR